MVYLTTLFMLYSEHYIALSGSIVEVIKLKSANVFVHSVTVIYSDVS